MMCRPFFRLKYKIRASTFIVPILLTAPLYTLPRFFEVESYSNSTYVCYSNSSYWFTYGSNSDVATTINDIDYMTPEEQLYNDTNVTIGGNITGIMEDKQEER